MEIDALVRGTIKAEKALLIYRLDGGYEGSAHYVTVHDVVDGALAEGRPMTKQSLVELCGLVMPEIEKTVKFLPAEVLAYTPGHDHGLVMWWAPAGVRNMFFERSTGIPNGPAPVPATLFLVRGGRLNVWALDVKERPGPDTPVYHSPYFNVFSHGTCMGNVRTPKRSSPRDIGKWERLFFESAFTKEAAPELKGIEGSVLWKGLVNSGKKRFPVKHLKRYQKATVGGLLNGYY